MSIKCPCCGKRFEPGDNNEEFCSDDCMDKFFEVREMVEPDDLEEYNRNEIDDYLEDR